MVEILERADGHIIGTWGRVMLLVFRERASGPGIDHAQELLRGWADSAAVIISVVPPQPPRPPDAETRAAMERAVRDPIPGLKGAGTLYEGSGFIAAAIRSAVSRLQRLRTGESLRFFRTTNEAAAWAAELLQAPSITGQKLAAAIAEVREG